MMIKKKVKVVVSVNQAVIDYANEASYVGFVDNPIFGGNFKSSLEALTKAIKKIKRNKNKKKKKKKKVLK